MPESKGRSPTAEEIDQTDEVFFGSKPYTQATGNEHVEDWEGPNGGFGSPGRRVRPSGHGPYRDEPPDIHH